MAIKASGWSKFQSSFRESLKNIGPNLAGMFLCMVCPSGVTFVPISHPTIHPVVLEKQFVLHISHRVAMLNYVPRWWPSWIFNRSKK
jgi:hypothetical protein